MLILLCKSTTSSLVKQELLYKRVGDRTTLFQGDNVPCRTPVHVLHTPLGQAVHHFISIQLFIYKRTVQINIQNNLNALELAQWHNIHPLPYTTSTLSTATFSVGFLCS